MNHSKIIIVGAGITGLNLASKLELDNQSNHLLILEKSKSVGGRIATRRTEKGSFDHGAQFISKFKETEPLIENLLKHNFLEYWFTNHTEKYKSSNGLTQLSKKISKNLIQNEKVKFQAKLLDFEQLSTNSPVFKLRVFDEITQNEFFMTCDQLILTAPLPQSLDILNKSNLNFSDKETAQFNLLAKITYAKALVGLVEDIKTNYELTDFGYVENPIDTVFSISDQQQKKMHSVKSWTVVINPSFSHEYFDRSESEILNFIQSQLIRLDSNLSYSSIQLKKWRYSHPEVPFESTSEATITDDRFYCELRPQLFLAGDAFGGPSIKGALKSSEALLKRLKI